MRRRSVRPFVGRGRTGSPPRAGDPGAGCFEPLARRFGACAVRGRARLPAPRRPPASRRALPIVDPDDRSHHRHPERLARPARPEPSPARQHHAPMGVDQQPGRPRRNSPGKLTTSSPQPARRPASSVCIGSPDHRPASCPLRFASATVNDAYGAARPGASGDLPRPARETRLRTAGRRGCVRCVSGDLPRACRSGPAGKGSPSGRR